MRLLGLAAAAAVSMVAAPAAAAVIHVTFEIESDNWMQVEGVVPAYGLPADPFLTGSFDIDESSNVGGISDASAIQNFSLQVGSRLFTSADLTASSFVTWTMLGNLNVFQVHFGGDNGVSSQAGARFDDGVNDYACNACVTVTSPTTGDPPAIPEPSTWALLIAGFGLAGAALRRQAVRPSSLIN